MFKKAHVWETCSPATEFVTCLGNKKAYFINVSIINKFIAERAMRIWGMLGRVVINSMFLKIYLVGELFLFSGCHEVNLLSSMMLFLPCYRLKWNGCQLSLRGTSVITSHNETLLLGDLNRYFVTFV